MQNTNTDLINHDGTPKGNKILVYEKGKLSFHLGVKQGFKSKQEAQRYYATRYTVDSMPYSNFYYQKGCVYRRLFPTTRKACNALIARLNPPSLLP